MNISITFRHMEPSEAIKAYAQDKVSKLQKFLRRPLAAKVTLSLQKQNHVAETRVSSGGEHLEAMEESEDIYASIDKVIDKLERQIRGTKGAAQAKKRGSETVRGGRQPKALKGVAAALPSVVAKAQRKPASRVKTRAKGSPVLASSSSGAKVPAQKVAPAKRPASR
jgi:putative sigma-54 modulation protein